MAQGSESCALCQPDMLLFGDALGYVRYDNNSLSPGHLLVVPRRHVANFFHMTWAEKTAVLALLDRAKAEVESLHSPDGYNIGVNIGPAWGQSRMHVHVHLIPRYKGDVAFVAGAFAACWPGSSRVSPSAFGLRGLTRSSRRRDNPSGLSRS